MSETMTAGKAQGPRAIKRRTTPLYLRVSDEVRKRAETQAATTKESISEYVSRLVREDSPRASAVAARLPALLGHRCVAALDACEARIRAGDDCSQLIGDLWDIRWDIVAALEALRAPYDAELDSTNDPPFDGKRA